MSALFRPAAVAAALLAALACPLPALADGIIEEPLPRFEDRICPGVLGMERDHAELMVSHLRDNVEMFGLRLAGSEEEGCEPNLVITFVEDGRGYLTELMQRRGYLFSDMDRADREELVAGDAPWRVWHQVTAHTLDGLRVGSHQNLTQPPEAGMWQAHSRIYRPVRHDITYALVLFDSDAVAGMTVRQLADFATMQALATEFPDGAEQSAGSMLQLFTRPDAAPASLGPVDAQWLATLYGGIPNLPASMRLRSVEVATAD